jgi:hypothetical protein
MHTIEAEANVILLAKISYDDISQYSYTSLLPVAASMVHLV